MDKLVADEEYLSAIMTSVVLPRLGEPLDIANAALFLACDESKFVTGSLLTVDGGMTCHQNVLPRTITRAQATDGAAS
jgi:NAD(P)-dependent dehydrogenase (short-subunit alcohol dehydrogenase family)